MLTYIFCDVRVFVDFRQKKTKKIFCQVVIACAATMVSLRVRPVILLFGDSLTQLGFGENGGVGWASLVASAYIRRADVLNRGFSGYNTRHSLDVLERVLGGTAPQTTEQSVLFGTVFLGANDAALPGEPQHVPIDEYAENLAKIVTTMR